MIGISGLLYWEKEKITQQYFSEMEKAQIEKNSLREELHKAKTEKEKNIQALLDLEQKFAELQKRHSKLEIEYKDALNLKQFLADKFVEYTNVTKNGWQKFEDISNKLNKQMVTFSKISDQLLPQIQQEESKKSALETPRGTIELPAVIVKDKGAEVIEGKALTESNIQQKASSLQSAKIMSINRAHNFVVINKGVVDGIKKDDVFIAERNGQVVAKVKVTEIRDFVSLGLIQNMNKKLSLMEGDGLYLSKS